MFDAATLVAYLSAQTPLARAQAVRDQLGSGTLTGELRDGATLKYSGTISGPLVAHDDGSLTIAGALAGAVLEGGTPDASSWTFTLRRADGARSIVGSFGPGGRFRLSGGSLQVGAGLRLNLTMVPPGGTAAALAAGALTGATAAGAVTTGIRLGGAATGKVTAAGAVASSDPTAAPRVQSTDITYVGSFRLPDTGAIEFDYAGTNAGGMALGASGTSLFVPAMDSDGNDALGEVSIPGTLGTGALSGWPTATLVQTPRDPSNGQRQIGPTYDRWNLGGGLIHNNRLIFAAWDNYDGGTGTQNKSHYSRPVNLATTGDTQGPLTLSGAPARWLGGYMCPIPAEWQSLFGKPALTGISGINTVGSASVGPCAAMFDPGNLTSCTLLVGYPEANDLAVVMGTSVSNANPYWNYIARVRGIAFPAGSRSVLFFGKHAMGAQTYGVDPVTGYHGYYGYPERYQVWAYDANDLLAVKNGTTTAGSLQPYAVWELTVPNGTPEVCLTGGCVYNPTTKQLYFHEASRDTTNGRSRGVIHVYQVAGV